VAFVTSQARPPVAFHTLFAILSSSSVFELDSFTERISCPRCIRPLRGARLLRPVGQETRLSDVGEKMAFKLAELDLSPQVNIVVASVDGHMADGQVRTSSKVARGTPKWRSS
jgi:hypothetical protein